MKEYQVKFLSHAENDILKMARYISNELYNPEAAAELVAKMRAKANGLKTMPDRYKKYEPFTPLKKEFRQIIIENYTMFYFIDEKKSKVFIAYVMHHRQDYDLVLATFKIGAEDS
jgi:plasmid stabilization system protein ParE